MDIKQFEKIMNEICPLDLQEEWDNCGIQISIPNKDIKKILVALEVTELVIDQAKALGADMILTHHPLFFGAFKNVTEDLLPTRYTIDLIQSGISCYSSHTNFDTMDGGNNDYLGKLLGFKDVKPFGMLRVGKPGKIQGSKGKIPTIEEIAAHIYNTLNIENGVIRLIGDPARKVKTLCWCTGAGADFVPDARDIGVDLFITGDLKYHEAMTCSELGVNVLDIGHFDSELIFAENMANILRKALQKRKINDVEVIESNMNVTPFDVIVL